MSERLTVGLQYVLPKRALTQLAGKLAGVRAGKLTTAVIRWFIKRYGVNMDEAANPDPASYASLVCIGPLPNTINGSPSRVHASTTRS